MTTNISLSQSMDNPNCDGSAQEGPQGDGGRSMLV